MIEATALLDIFEKHLGDKEITAKELEGLGYSCTEHIMQLSINGKHFASIQLLKDEAGKAPDFCLLTQKDDEGVGHGLILRGSYADYNKKLKAVIP